MERISAPTTALPSSSLTRRDRFVLDSVHATPNVRRLGVVGGIAYYLGKSDSGGTCFMSGDADGRDTHFGSAGCGSGDYPSAAIPILDDSAFRVVTTDAGRMSFLTMLGGIAADGVARVGVTDVEGNFVSTPVHHNLYFMRPTKELVATALVAKDGSGKTVYSFPLAR